jgi:GTPase SAR1 family protein
MKDGFMKCAGYNMTIGSRDFLEGEYQKTVIVVCGKSGIGKTSLCGMLRTENVDYISLDYACVDTECNTKEVFECVKRIEETYGELVTYHLDGLCRDINEYCSNEWAKFVFDKYVLNNESLNILMDGYAFSMPKIYDAFVELCLQNNYRVWKVERA